MTTHADLLAIVERAPERRYDPARHGDRVAHLDTLRAILYLHQPVGSGKWETALCEECTRADPRDPAYRPWPCPTVQVVADALTRMGALP